MSLSATDLELIQAAAKAGTMEALAEAGFLEENIPLRTVAKRLDVHPDTVRRWTRDGKLHRRGGNALRPRYDWSEVQRDVRDGLPIRPQRAASSRGASLNLRRPKQ